MKTIKYETDVTSTFPITALKNLVITDDILKSTKGEMMEFKGNLYVKGIFVGEEEKEPFLVTIPVSYELSLTCVECENDLSFVFKDYKEKIDGDNLHLTIKYVIEGVENSYEKKVPENPMFVEFLRDKGKKEEMLPLNSYLSKEDYALLSEALNNNDGLEVISTLDDLSADENKFVAKRGFAGGKNDIILPTINSSSQEKEVKPHEINKSGEPIFKSELYVVSYFYHRVSDGETALSIASKYHLSVEYIENVGGKNLKVGQLIRIRKI